MCAICSVLRFLPLVNCSMEFQGHAEVLQDFCGWRWQGGGAVREGGRGRMAHDLPQLKTELLHNTIFIHLSNSIQFGKSLAKKKKQKKTEPAAWLLRVPLSNM